MFRFKTFSTHATWCVPLLLVAWVAGCDGARDPVLSIDSNIATAPAVTSASPIDGAAGIPTNVSRISVFFSEAIAPITANIGASFTVTCAAPCVNPAGTVALDSTSRIATFTPAAPLASSTLYTITVTGPQSLATGVPLAVPYISRFTTGSTADSTRPRVTTTVPSTTTPGPTASVATNTAITATFSEDMAPSTINATSFTLTCVTPCVSPSGSVSYVSSSRTAVFAPTASLNASATYTATITSAASDLASNTLGGNQAALPATSSYVWTFTTGASADATAPTVSATNPATASVGVCANKTISATFSEPMNPQTITTSSFTLSVTNGASVAGVVAYDAATRIATFDPTANLTATPSTNYTATIRGGANGVKDVAGNPLATNSVTTFATSASTCTTAPALGAAASFGGFGGNATLTNDGLATRIFGDIGVNASSTTVTGLRDTGGNVYTVTPNNDGLVNGLIHTLTAPPGSVAGAVVTQVRADGLVAFNSISPGSLPGGIDVSSLAQCPSCGGAGGGPDELAGRTLPPGVYSSATGTYDIGGVGRTTANLTLDAGGDANAVFIFQTAAGIGTLNVGLTGPATPAVPIQVLLINGAQAKNVFWYVPAGAAIGTGSTMVGTMLANASITLSTTGGTPPTAVITTLNGRAISLTAGVTMTNTVINVPSP